MSDRSAIEWTDATWNPVRGCTRKSPGCGGPGPHGGCYAEQIAARFSDPGQQFHGFAERTPYGGRWTGKVALIPELLDRPLHWRRPRRIFVNSMSDLFHEALPVEDVAQVVAYIAASYWHTHQVLTKRSDRARELLNDERFREMVADYLPMIDAEAGELGLYDVHSRRTDDWRAQCPDVEGDDWPLPNLWLGTSCERQQEADERIPHLLETPAAVRFVSCEPLLGPVDLSGWLFGRQQSCAECPKDEDCDCGWQGRHTLDWESALHWIIVGGESGPKARPMHPNWARSIRDQCRAAGAAFFFKQWGEWLPGHHFTDELSQRDSNPEQSRFRCMDWDGDRAVATDGMWCDDVDEHAVWRVGKKAAGRLLDGRTHDDFPVLPAGDAP
jgi:protein gp37